MRWALAYYVVVSLLPAAAGADPMKPYNLQTLSFDMWCQERQHYAPERCDARSAVDEEAYQAWRATIERYELPYLKRVEEDYKLQRVIDHDVSGRPSTTGIRR